MAQTETSGHDIAGTGRALVAINTVQDQTHNAGPSGIFLPDAGFLAQIIASAGHMGHFRRYRRAEPAFAMNSYNSAANLMSER